MTEADAARPDALLERVADAVRDPSVTAASLQALWDEAQQLRSGMAEAEGDCMKQSLDPGASVSEARQARNSAADFAHEGRRLEAAMASLDEVLPTVRAAEHRAAIMPAYEKYRDERAAFIERLRDRWPKLTAEMLELIQTIERYRHEPGVEIPDGEDPLRGDVEMEARDLPSFHLPTGPVASFASARLPKFENDPWKRYLWTEQMKGLKSW
ncbi:hypothetical protein SAMN04515666_103615 [Bosea lupini]|uniref:Uncharacterized protein n=1 Tax=Bosea lupini TaxID=1036779 RepID=A0A1H7PUG1_9HYPH|nr:hypothetical protein [Bosea lupini]SEL39480.1 hypothetical protein SAMN04515666_103615 [Bosea lupini]